MRPSAHQELTDEENERILGTLTHEAWVGLSVENIASDWYRLDTDLEYLKNIKNPAEKLVHEARLSSGSIEGAHRRDLKEAIIGAVPQGGSLSVPIINQPVAQAPQVAEKKRGF